MWLLLLAQLAQPAKPSPAPAAAAPAAAAPAAPKATEPTQPTPPTRPQSGASGAAPESRDPRTGATTQREGADVLPVDPRTTRDDQFDPRAAAQSAEEQASAATRAQAQAAQMTALTGTRIRVVDPEGRIVQHRPIEITSTASIVGGYNSNVIQTQDTLDGPVTRRAALYNAIEGRVTVDFWGKGEEPHSISLQVLGQQYYKLHTGDPSLPQDGSILALYGGGFQLGKNTRLGIRAFSSVQTLNSTRQQDGVLFQVDPANLQRTFTLSNLTFQLQHEITPTTRYVHLVGATMSTTLRDEPTLLTDGSRLFHRGLDFVQFNTIGAVLHDFGTKVRGFFDVEYEGIYNNFFLDFTRVVPVRRGDFSQHLVRSNIGATYIFSDALSGTGRVGGAVATVPSPSLPADPTPDDPNALNPNDRSAIFSPQASGELLYQKPTFNAELIAGYTFGSANPRIGFGRTVQVDAVVGGVPFPNDKALRNIAVLVTGSVSRAILRPTNDGEAFLTFIGATALVRYKLTNWLGALGGYSNRYVNFAGTLEAPALMRHQVFFGLSGYFTTDTTEPPPLSVFAPPRPTG